MSFKTTIRFLLFPLLLGTASVYGQSTAKGEPVAMVSTDNFHPEALDNQQSMSAEQRAGILRQIYTLYAMPYNMRQDPTQTHNGVKSTRINILGDKSPIAYCVLYEKGNAMVATVVDKQGSYSLWQGGEPGFINRINSSGKVIETVAVDH